MRTLAAALAALLLAAGCDDAEVPADRMVVIAVDVSAYLSDTPPGMPQHWVLKNERRATQVASEAPAADVLLHPNIGYYAGHDVKYRRRVMEAAERYTREQMPRVREALARSGIKRPRKVPG